MQSVNIHTLSLSSFLKNYPNLSPPPDFVDHARQKGSPLARETAIEHNATQLTHGEFGPTGNAYDLAAVPVLVITIPSAEADLLELFARRSPDVYNENSADLGISTTYLSWSGAGREVRVNSRELRLFPGGMETRRLFVVFMSGESVTISDRRLDADDMDSLLSGIQGAQGSTGPNYQPWRIWSEAVMAACEGLAEENRCCVLTAQVVPDRAIKSIWW